MTQDELNKILNEGKLTTTIISVGGETKFEYYFKGRTWIEDNQLTNEEIVQLTNLN
jgi:hypothetical protein